MANLDYTVIGNLTAKPYFRRFDSGSTVLRFRVATSDAKKVTDDNGKDGWEDFNQFYVDVECWGQLALNAGASLRKGFPVIVVGKLVHEYWEEKAADGTTNMRSRVKMKARYIGFDLARYQVNSVRATASGNTLDGHEPPTAMDAAAIDRKLNGDDANQNVGREDAGTQGGWSGLPEDPAVQERRVSAEDLHFDDTADSADAAGTADAAGEENLAGAGARTGNPPF